MKGLLNSIDLKIKLIFLIIFPSLGFIFISGLYINQILSTQSNQNLTFTIVFILLSPLNNKLNFILSRF